MLGIKRSLGWETALRYAQATAGILIMSLVTLMVAVTAVAGDLGTEAYRLPLVDPFAVFRSDEQWRGSADTGPYQLVEVMPSEGAGLQTVTIVPKVELVAVQDQVIFGKGADSFFVMDTRQSHAQPQVMKTRDEWEEALRHCGILNADVVKTPDELAAGLSEHVLRPWKYRVAGGRLGISDDVLSLLVQLLGFLIAFVVGLVWPRNRSPMPTAVVLGLIVNVVAMILIAGGGPGAFVGFVALPLVCMLAAALGKGLRVFASRGRTARE